jgi:hypothetical protein
MKNKAITAFNTKYIFFLDETEMYSVNPFKLINTDKAFKDTDVKSWKMVNVIVGDDLKDLGVNIGKYPDYNWFITDEVNDHTFRALIALF